MRGHVSPNHIAAYIDRALDDITRRQFEDHLAECTECRAELVGAHRALRGRPLHRRPMVMGPVIAAAAIVLFMVMPRGPTSSSAPPVLRAGSDTLNGIQRVQAVRPAAGASIRADDRTFIWQTIAEGANYRMSLTQLDGAPMWSLETMDTSAVVPNSVDLEAGETYLWLVDALLTDGSQAKTEVRSFIVTP